MSNPKINKLWKEKAEIDYIPPFMSLWISLNAWMKDSFIYQGERKGVELLKDSAPLLLDKFKELISAESLNGILFRGYFGELHRALSKAHIPYQIRPNKEISFECCIIDWNNGNPQFESILMEVDTDNLPFEVPIEVDFEVPIEADFDYLSFKMPIEVDKVMQKTIALDDDLKVENNPERLFAAYIEIVYQIRCALFNGDLAPTPEESKKVIQHLYLTLSMVMEDI